MALHLVFVSERFLGTLYSIPTYSQVCSGVLSDRFWSNCLRSEFWVASIREKREKPIPGRLKPARSEIFRFSWILGTQNSGLRQYDQNLSDRTPEHTWECVGMEYEAGYRDNYARGW